MPKPPTAAIIVPTNRRAGYLDRALATVVPQARAHDAEVIVVDDAGEPATEAVAARHGARYLHRQGIPGPNAARNTAIAATSAELLCLLDDDVEVADCWLACLIAAATELPPEVGVLAGRIQPRLIDHHFRSCGREDAPITELDGDQDHDCKRGWAANLAIRRSAIDQVGVFDERLGAGVGDEEEWQQRWLDQGGRIRYIAGATVDHVRRGDDARLRSLCRSAYYRGKAGRRYDNVRGQLPGLKQELRTLAACALHGPRRLCFSGPVMTAHSLGRVAEALKPTPLPAQKGVDDFLSGVGGQLGGKRAHLLKLEDSWLDLSTWRRRRRVRQQARQTPSTQRVLVIGVYNPAVPHLIDELREELQSSRHEVVVDLRTAGPKGKFGNLNEILDDHELSGFDFLLATDDDISLPRGFLDLLIHCADRGDLALAQPAHRRRSHAAWPVTRRTSAAWRETNFVEIGPMTLFARSTFDTLLPFPAELRQGWGLDTHWSAIARERGWRMGVVDIAAVDHSMRGIAVDYARADAVAEAREFLADRPYTARDEVRTLATHR